MTNLAKIVLVQRYQKVNYYTVRLIDDEESLFAQFLRKHTWENKEKLQHILAWIRVIGNKIGAKKEYFRNEAEIADVSGLPPMGKDREPAYVEYNDFTKADENTPNNLRLYCLRANDHVVFLFGGDVKTAKKAQDCEQVRPHFRLANNITKCVEKNFGVDITWNADYTDILFDIDLELNW